FDVKNFGLDAKTTKVLLETIKQRMKPAELEIKGTFDMKTYEPEGVEHLRETMKKMEHPQITVKYLGGGKYSFQIKSTNYDDAEDLFSKHIQNIVEEFGKTGGEIKIERD
ncbi:hypothetical protein GF371_02140, partial [Candidatus Woesearchaeota archaeon]|nr:hypothetical protein [Candidatus Woesearchaeota archaeon]